MSEWISVDDRLPDMIDEVLMYDKNEGMDIAFCSNGSWFLYASTKSVNPSHWMPLPEPPK